MDKDKMKILMNPHGKGLKFTIVALEYSIEQNEKIGKDSTLEKKLLKEAQKELRARDNRATPVTTKSTRGGIEHSE